MSRWTIGGAPSCWSSNAAATPIVVDSALAGPSAKDAFDGGFVAAATAGTRLRQESRNCSRSAVRRPAESQPLSCAAARQNLYKRPQQLDRQRRFFAQNFVKVPRSAKQAARWVLPPWLTADRVARSTSAISPKCAPCPARRAPRCLWQTHSTAQDHKQLFAGLALAGKSFRRPRLRAPSSGSRTRMTSLYVRVLEQRGIPF